MAMGKYSRVDGKKSSSYGLTITIVLLVSLCLVGGWMLMSAPADSVGYSSTRDSESATNNNDTRKEEGDRDLKKVEENEVVDESSGEKAESVEERKEKDDSNGDGNGEKEKKIVEEVESESDEAKEKEKTRLEESTEENRSEDGNGNEEKSEEKSSGENVRESTEKKSNGKDVYPAGDQAEITKETSAGDGAWSTQLVESQKEKKSQESKDQSSSYGWKTCNVTAGPDYIPCLDNWQAIKKLQSTMHYEHRERHCPEESPRCLVSLPDGYKRSIKWPGSREKVKLVYIFWQQNCLR